MRRHVVVLIAVLGVRAGCGAGSAEREAAPPSASPSPTAYTPDQLKSALPGKDELPATGKLSFSCPSDDDLCGKDAGKDAFSQGGSVDAASPVGAEQIESSATPVDFFALNVERHATAAEATKLIEGLRKDTSQYVGTFDIPDKKVAGGRVAPGRKGAGAQEPRKVGVWNGYSTTYTARSSTSVNDEGVQVSQFYVANGRSTVLVFVSLSAAEREASAAQSLADSLVRDYLERLG